MDEVVTPEMAAPEVEEVGQPQTIEAEQDLQKVVEDPKDRQWRELRKSKDDLERKARDLENKSRMQEQLLEKILSNQMVPANSQKAQAIEEDVVEELSKMEYASGEQIAKAMKKIEARYEKKLDELEGKYKKTAGDDKLSRLKSKHPDLEDVVNLDTLKTFAEQNPDIAETWQGRDDYSIYVQAYPLIKNSGILDDKGIKRARDVEKKIEQNKKTVQSPQAFDKRPMAQAFDYSRMNASQKEELQREMNQYASMAGGVPPIG